MAILIYDDEYKGHVADAPELPVRMSWGKTVDAALKNIREAISLYLETAPRKRKSSSRRVLTTTLEI